jgi:hydroxyacyl-ACP dehydratase HTD2-like protein with hotdog domain
MGKFWSGGEGERKIPPLAVTVSKVRMMMYAAATWNPYQLHWDSDYSKRQGFPDANVAGPMFGDYLAEMLVRWAGSPSRVRKLEYTNRAMAFPADRLVFRGTAGEQWENEEETFIKCRVWAENQEGRVLVEGSAVVSLS